MYNDFFCTVIDNVMFQGSLKYMLLTEVSCQAMVNDYSVLQNLPDIVGMVSVARKGLLMFKHKNNHDNDKQHGIRSVCGGWGGRMPV